jgi:uncharacterized protein
MLNLNHELKKAQKAKKPLHKFLDKLKKHPPRNLDEQAIQADENTFANLDCLHCANCCKTISPIFTPRDVERIAATLKISPGKFTETYLRIDADQDMVLQSTPCPFLQPDNKCRIYEDRPKACREYPHTAQRKFSSRIELTKKNILVCPAAFRIVEELQKIYEPPYKP